MPRHDKAGSMSIPHDPDYCGSEEIEGSFEPVQVGQATKLFELAEATGRLVGCESPIEIMLGSEILVRLKDVFAAGRLELVSQYPLNPYRFDFAIRRQDAPKPFLLIECDGAAFHTSPEQRDHDLRKDQWAKLHGFDVVRFTGSDINTRPLECIAVLAAKLHRPIEGA